MKSKMKYNIDPLDEELIRALGSDARDGAKEIIKHHKVSPSTIRRRISHLIKMGVMRVIGVFDPVKVGYPICAIMAFSVSYECLDSIVDLLVTRPEVKYLVVTTGRYDIIALVFVRSHEELANFVRKGLGKPPGLQDVETFVGLETKKGRFVALFLDAESELTNNTKIQRTSGK